jgi:hypothetical protein
MMRNSSVSDNDVTVTVASSEDGGPSGSALEFGGDATIANSRITGNRTTVTSPTGVAGAVGAVSAFGHGAKPALITNSVISHNSVRATSETGTATIQGVGVTSDGRLRLRNVLISDNHGTASGAAGFARGGGIWNDVLFFEPPVELALENTLVTHNTLNASAGISVRGDGMFTAFPVTSTNSLIAQNTPDQCVGC